MRQAFSETLYNLAETDPRVVFITGDLGFQVFDKFRADFKARFINAGVAEAQMIYTAAGLASEGFRPIAYSIASFATGRPYEQLRYCVGYPGLPVILVGAGRGYLYSTSGVSHHAPDDLALMRLIPGMAVVAPGDPIETRALLPQLMKWDGPGYFTVGKYGEPTYDAAEAPVFGKARCLVQGSTVAILSIGEVANEVVTAVKKLRDSGVTPSAYQFHTLQPFDEQRLDAILQAHSSILVVEEHLPQGGLYSRIAEYVALSGTHGAKIVRLGPPHAFALGNLKQADLRKKIGVDAGSIVNAAVALAQR